MDCSVFISMHYQMARWKKIVKKGILSWCKTKFSELILKGIGRFKQGELALKVDNENYCQTLSVVEKFLRQNQIGNQAISVLSRQRPCTKIHF